MGNERNQEEGEAQRYDLSLIQKKPQSAAKSKLQRLGEVSNLLGKGSVDRGIAKKADTTGGGGEVIDKETRKLIKKAAEPFDDTVDKASGLQSNLRGGKR